MTEEGKQKNKRCMKEYLKIYRKNRSSNLLKKVKEDNALRNVSVDVVTNSSNMKQKVLLMMMMNKIGLFDSDKICLAFNGGIYSSI